LRAVDIAGERITALDFGDETLQLGGDDKVILAVPPVVAAALLPGLEAPDDARRLPGTSARVRRQPPTTRRETESGARDRGEGRRARTCSSRDA
jgi:hypothetical protein